jgi:hypothetical protein
MSDDPQADRSTWAREALERANKLKDLMVAVATGGPRIEAVTFEYQQLRQELHGYLDALGVADINPFSDLWAWLEFPGFTGHPGAASCALLRTARG